MKRNTVHFLIKLCQQIIHTYTKYVWVCLGIFILETFFHVKFNYLCLVSYLINFFIKLFLTFIMFQNFNLHNLHNYFQIWNKLENHIQILWVLNHSLF